MRKFYYDFVCRDSTRDIDTAVQFLRVFEKILKVRGWSSDRQLAEHHWIAQEFEKSRRRTLRRFSQMEDPLAVGWGVYLTTESYPLNASILLFSKESACIKGDSFTLNFADVDGHPSAESLLEAVTVVKPSWAAVSEYRNQENLDRRARARTIMHSSNPDRICMVHWLNYLDHIIVENMGGMEHVLKTPAFRVQPFLDGVSIQLTDEYLEPDNPQHLALQRAAMEHLGIWEYDPQA